ncbi:MAG: hypothetical protein M1812_004057 [Candelaria pacifica]|nr:MAG: hypothetical protein M1812_004057 [Candelaria pacifica]
MVPPYRYTRRVHHVLLNLRRAGPKSLPITFWAMGIAAGTVAYNTESLANRLQNDSKKDIQWPQTRATITDPNHGKSDRSSQLRSSERKEFELEKQTARQSLQSPNVHPSSIIKDEDSTAWANFATGITKARASISSIEWTSIGDSIADFILPDWAKLLPGYIIKLQKEMSMAPGSLADLIWDEAHNAEINPEIEWNAVVRVSNEICTEERTFVQNRKKHTCKALAYYLDLPERDIHPDDVPTIAVCGSGGGLRALVAGTGSYLCAQEAGLFDCVTYTAGVSGSCWLQALYYSTIGAQNHARLIEHLKSRLGVHIAFPPTALSLLTSAPTDKFLISGFVEKLKGDRDADFGLVDIYGLLLGTRLLVPKGELGVDDRDLKISNQRTYIQEGQNPMPIYTAIRHEIPLEVVRSEAEKAQGKKVEDKKEEAKREAWFQWFEFTPYEFWCEELEAGIPTWSIGRAFENGRSKYGEEGLGLPELRMPLLMGIWGSAFCATLSHYYKEIRPVLKGLAGFGGIDDLIEERNEDLIKLHPIDAASIPNCFLGMHDQLPPTCPASVLSASHLKLMDAGMSNNLPIYPLLRPGREIEILIAFDASADIKNENWLSVADGYARQRGIKGWPVGAGWPKSDAPLSHLAEELDAAQATSVQQAAGKIAEVRGSQQATGTQSANSHEAPNDANVEGLGYCNVWVGSTAERKTATEPPQSKLVKEGWELMDADAGLTVIYFPFLPNPRIRGVDPNTSDFMSTWNFIYTPEEIDKVVALARANFEQGQEQTKRAVRAVYERKKKRREQREERQSQKRWRKKILSNGDHFS